MEKEDRCFTLLHKLRRNRPFWFHHALTYCQFDRSQLESLLETSPGDDLFEEPSIVRTYSKRDILYAIECGLIEPIFRSIAEYHGNQFDEVMKLMQATASCSKRFAFPWMFLAYLGVCCLNLPLVERCISIIIEEKKAGSTQEFEVGISYQVWRFLIRQGGSAASSCSDRSAGGLNDEMKLAILELPLVKHDWTFVHLASAYGDAECLEILLTRPCNQNIQVLRDVTEVEGFTPLHLAACYGRVAVTKLLLEHADKFDPAAASGNAGSDGAEFAQDERMSQRIPRDRIFKRSPLHFAAVSDFDESEVVVSLLIDKWGSVGVDLPDRFGITSLHVAAASNCNVSVLKMLLSVSRNPLQRVHKGNASQKTVLLCFLRALRRYVNGAATSSLLFIPEPLYLIKVCFFWCNVGFTFLHVLAIWGGPEHLKAVLEHESSDAALWAARDCQGLSAVDYADSEQRMNRFVNDAKVKDAAAMAEPLKAIRTTFLTRVKVQGQTMEGAQFMEKVLKLGYTYRIISYLLSGNYATAENLSAQEGWQDYSDVRQGLIGSWKKWRVDDEVWDHLEWALNKTLQPARDVGLKLQSWQAERIVLNLAVYRKVLQGKSPKQRCLQWAIGKRMAILTEELIKDRECELVTLVPGSISRFEESPLARASNSKVVKVMPGLLAAMELREDVKRRWFEDRQVYVDYANTLLVGAVLIAGLAFAGWLQPPQGYTDIGAIDMKRHTMRVFVYSTSLAFFLGVGTMVAAATGAMPFAIGAGKLIRARDRVHKSLVIASILLVGSLVCLSVSFAAALLDILPREDDNTSVSAFLAVQGVLLCAVLVSFLRRLEGLSCKLPRLVTTVKWPHLVRVVKLWARKARKM